MIDFRSKSYRDSFLRAYKGNKDGIKTSDIGFDGIESTIYVNESLSQDTRRIFNATRKFSKENGYRYCWIQDGRVLLRRDETSGIVRITTEKDLARLPPH